VDTLDALLDAGGELLIARRRTALELDDLGALHDELRAMKTGWQRVAASVRQLLRRDPQLFARRTATDVERTDMHLKALEHRVDQFASRTQAAQHALDSAATTVEAGIRRTRLVPFAQACDGLALAVRDPAFSGAAPVDLVVEGGEVRLGRMVVDALRAPLLQLTRNALAHGAQTGEERHAAGKPARGRITVSATLHGDTAEIVVSDDGRGLDRRAIAEVARGAGLAVPQSDADALAVIFRPGFSTSAHTSSMSGRGVGLDIVRHQADVLRGHAEAALIPDGGLRISMRVPVTLTTLRALLVKEAGQTFAIPLAGIRRLTRAAATDLASAGGRDMLLTAEGPIPAARLGRLLGIDASPTPAERIPLVILGIGREQAAVAVQELLTEEEILVKSLGPRLQRVRHVAGATLLPSGRVALILNPARIVQAALTMGVAANVHSVKAVETVHGRRRVLLVDDSVTTRTLERSILETAGYDVVVAVDGAQAWNLLQSAGADVVVADVEMPRMDGLALCEAIRHSKRFRDLPVVLVTGVENDAARRRGLEAGANAYLPKSTFDQQSLLDAIGRLLQ
jgi:two-component system chemotaxis sensor kinase CheA